jgi:TPR repeat protein
MIVGLPFWWLKNSFLIVLILFSSTVNATDETALDKATVHMKTGDFAKAYCLVQPLAEEGNAHAQYLLGWMYHNGYGLRINDEQTLAWWNKAAEQNYADANYSIGLMYELGEGVKQDTRKALDAYLSGARKSNKESKNSVKRMLNNEVVFDYLLEISIEEYDLFAPDYKVIVNRANVRKDPDSKAKIVSVLKQGDTVIVLEQTESWSKIILRRKGKVAWIYSSLLKKRPCNDPLVFL